MKKLILSSIAFLALCSVSFAQDGKKAKQKQQEQNLKMKKGNQPAENLAAKASLYSFSGPRPEKNDKQN